ncbi:MAG: hypothetical protein K2X43_17325 [Hyphomonadaceae bacterium]|nr:hypothetical protein [Hyphomonadaceae bacterium]
MTQQWLTVVGLAFDFVGFMLLLREWWLAFFNEARQIEMEEQLERVRALRNLRPAQPGQRNPFETLERVQDEAALRRTRTVHRAAMTQRKGTFLLATTLIVLGFMLQIAGAWPGCCPPWIAPQT